ncbi:MAG TPA: hypothetical protein VGJ60_07715 [Chloroflexota bacterium]|jgi:hypothetical protein
MTMEVLAGNGLQSTLSAAIDASTTVIPIQAADASAWPGSGVYRAVLFSDATNGPWEVLRVTAGQGTATLGVERAAEPFRGVRTARAWASGTSIAAVLTHDGLSALLQVATLSIQLEEFLPTGGANQVTLSMTPNPVFMVSRNGVIQSRAAGHYSVTDKTVTFAGGFSGSERVVISYATTGP